MTHVLHNPVLPSYTKCFQLRKGQHWWTISSDKNDGFLLISKGVIFIGESTSRHYCYIFAKYGFKMGFYYGYHILRATVSILTILNWQRELKIIINLLSLFMTVCWRHFHFCLPIFVLGLCDAFFSLCFSSFLPIIADMTVPSSSCRCIHSLSLTHTHPPTHTRLYFYPY